MYSNNQLKKIAAERHNKALAEAKLKKEEELNNPKPKRKPSKEAITYLAMLAGGIRYHEQ